MSVSAIPPAGLTLHGIPHGDASLKQPSTPAVLFKLSEELLEDVKKASGAASGLQFVTGTTPKIRLGKRTIDLTISPEAFQHELFSATTASLTHLQFVGTVGHRAELKALDRRQSLGSDAALAALQNSLATYHQEKAAKSVVVTNSVVGTPRNRWEANRDQKHAHRRALSGSQHPSPSISASGTPRIGAAPTSAPCDDSSSRLKAMRKPLIHLLAMGPLTEEEITRKTRIPKSDLQDILSRIGKTDGKKMGLSDRAYKELDVWKFAYRTQEERQAAIDNAVKAYDRQRIGKEEKIWQILLPEERRFKGEYLSKLHIGAPTHLTPNVAASPLPHAGAGIADDDEKPAASTAGTPKVTAAKSDLMKKLAKNPKQRAIEEAKEKKRKERESAKVDTDREPRAVKKPRTTAAKHNPKVKSAELVQSSSEDEVDTTSSQPKAAPPRRETTANAAVKAKSKPNASASASSSDAADKQNRAEAVAAPAKSKAGAPSNRTAATANAAARSKPIPPGKATPNGLHASSSSKSQLSPQKPQHRSTARSPLGAARPRVASDVSERAVLGGSQRARPGAETPKGLGISNVNGIRKRNDTVTSNSTDSSSNGASKTNGVAPLRNEKSRKTLPNGSGTRREAAAATNGAQRKVESGVKRKAVDSPQTDARLKHRKTESTSSHSQNSISAGSSNSDHDPTTLYSPRRRTENGIRMNFTQGVSLAEKFREELYPAYAKLYDELEAIEKRGETIPTKDKERLWKMHRRLEQVKREMREASVRENEDD